MSQCGICDIHNEIYLGVGLTAEENEYYDNKYDTDSAIWNADEVYEDYNLEIEESGICEHCLYDKYKVGS